ncbi:MAG: T9SS type A sorting domain-containing protein [Chitinophagaceae bacterium]
MKKFYLAFFTLLFILNSHPVFAQRSIIYAVSSGNWADPASWNLKRNPTHNDSIVIPSGKTVTLSGSQALTNSVLRIYGILVIDEASSIGNSIDLDIRFETNKSTENIIQLMQGTSKIQRGLNNNGSGRIRVQVNGIGNWITKYITGSTIQTGPAIAYNNSTEGFVVQLQASLPVILVDFSISNTEKLVNLKWKSPQENNNESYLVERSNDATIWVKIGDVKAVVYSYLPQFYTFTDESPTNGINYYRLRILDRDGKFGITQIKAARLSMIAARSVMYPNPVVSTATIFINDETASYFNICIYNKTGKMLSHFQVNNDSNLITIDAVKLPDGDYSVSVVSNSGNRQVYRFIVSKK